MKKLSLTLTGVIFLFILHAQKIIIADPDAEVRIVSGSYNKIIVSGGIDLYLSQYETESVAVSASAAQHRQGIKTEVENNILNIYYDDGKKWSSGNKHLKVYVSFKALEMIKASGASDVVVDGVINSASLSLQMSGASDFKGGLNVKELSMELSGSSDIKINGTAGTVTIQSSGASDVKGYDLVTDICTAKASGASDINITVNKELSAHASGASVINYRGDAVLKDMHTSGASAVAKKG